tara:strand:- start:905 stop:1129 length:225 start_codon:yes stop_codon:yes gene_type:complete
LIQVNDDTFNNYYYRILDGYSNMNQQSFYNFVTLCYYDAIAEEYHEESLYDRPEAIRKMKEHLLSGVCAWIKPE